MYCKARQTPKHDYDTACLLPLVVAVLKSTLGFGIFEMLTSMKNHRRKQRPADKTLLQSLGKDLEASVSPIKSSNS